MVGATLVGLANVYRDRKKYAQAEALQNKAVAIYRRSGGMDKSLASRMLRKARIWPSAARRQGI